MDRTCFTIPIQTGQTAHARAFLQELESQRKDQYAVSEQRLGISTEVWAIQESPGGDFFVVYIAADNLASAFQTFAASRDPFDRWFKERVATATGIDLNTPPPGPLSEVLSVYTAHEATT